MLEALSSDRYLALLGQIEAAATFPVATDSPVSLADIARGELTRLRRLMRQWRADAPDEALHRIRIQSKRAAYATELAESGSGKAATRFIRAIKRLRDLLGEHQDAFVVEQRLRALLSEASGRLTAFTYGRLIERQSERRRTARAALPTVWSRVKRRGKRI